MQLILPNSDFLLAASSYTVFMVKFQGYHFPFSSIFPCMDFIRTKAFSLLEILSFKLKDFGQPVRTLIITKSKFTAQ